MTRSEKGFVLTGSPEELAQYMMALSQLQEEKKSRDLANSIFGKMPFEWFSIQADEE